MFCGIKASKVIWSLKQNISHSRNKETKVSLSFSTYACLHGKEQFTHFAKAIIFANFVISSIFGGRQSTGKPKPQKQITAYIPTYVPMYPCTY
jgi:hypothetical protein